MLSACPHLDYIPDEVHNLLAHKLQKENIAYRIQDNTFAEILIVDAAQKLSDSINPKDLKFRKNFDK